MACSPSRVIFRWLANATFLEGLLNQSDIARVIFDQKNSTRSLYGMRLWVCHPNPVIISALACAIFLMVLR